MILTGGEIIKEVKRGRIHLKPFRKEFVNPNSYNFRLSKTLLVYKNTVLDPKVEQPVRKISIGKNGIILKPNKLYLGNTIEEMGSNYYVPLISGRSSVGRTGLFIDITAPLGDIGFKGQWTLQLCATYPVKVYYKMKIGQIMFWKTKGKIKLYTGKYQNARGPKKSKIYKDFKIEDFYYPFFF